MTHDTRIRVADWVELCFRGLVIAGLVIAISAFIRDYQTRALIDRPARDVAHRICVSTNAHWNAYLTTVTEIANKRRPAETDEQWAARKAQTERLVDKIRDSVTVNCTKVFP